MSKVYCVKCRLLVSHCICASRPECLTEKHWCLLMHPNEANKRSNSGFHAKQLLGDYLNAVLWARKSETLAADCAAEDGAEPVLLFPKAYVSDSVNVSEVYLADWHNRPLMILDATWQQARKMYRQSDWLQLLDVWSLPEPQNDFFPDFEYQLRRNQTESGCSTIETIAYVMALTGELDSARAMLKYFDLFQKDNNDPFHS